MRIDCSRASVKSYYTPARWLLRNDIKFFTVEVINDLDKISVEKINFMFQNYTFSYNISYIEKLHIFYSTLFWAFSEAAITVTQKRDDGAWTGNAK